MLRGAKNRMVMGFLVLRVPRCSATYCIIALLFTGSFLIMRMPCISGQRPSRTKTERREHIFAWLRPNAPVARSAEGEEYLVRTEFQGKAYEAFKALGLRPPEKVQPVLATVEATPL